MEKKIKRQKHKYFIFALFISICNSTLFMENTSSLPASPPSIPFLLRFYVKHPTDKKDVLDSGITSFYVMSDLPPHR